jgi:two-component system alkaline phosphatase synthesis response regulator PhoP
MSLHVIRHVELPALTELDGHVVVVRSGELELWGGEGQAWANGERVRFTPREFDVLFALAVRERHAISREQLYELVWQRPHEPGRRDVDVHVKRIRDKLARVSPGWRYLHTHQALGYRFEAERAGS